MTDTAPRTILVTGASGLLGTHLLPRLADERVVALGRPAANLSQPLDPASLPEKIDAVIYLAQSPRFRDFPDGAGDVFQVNVAQPLALLDLARRSGATHFVYASTGSVYAPSAEPIAEDGPLADPMGFYPASKRAAELLASAYAPHLNVAILRFFFLYGAGQKRDMLVPRLVDSVRQRRPISLQGRDGIRINPIHADDAALAVKAALDLDESRTINVAGPEILSIREMGDAIGARLGAQPVYAVKEGGAGGDLIGDIGAMSRYLIAPGRRFRDGVADCF
jgi:UDP-glucose 4-epimerase